MSGDTGDHEPEELRQRGAVYVKTEQSRTAESFTSKETGGAARPF